MAPRYRHPRVIQYSIVHHSDKALQETLVKLKRRKEREWARPSRVMRAWSAYGGVSKPIMIICAKALKNAQLHCV